MLVKKAFEKLGPFAHAFRHRGSVAPAATARYASAPKIPSGYQAFGASGVASRHCAKGRHLSSVFFIIALFFLLGVKVELKIDHGSGSFDFRRVAELKKGSTVFDLLSKERDKGELDFAYRDFGKMGALIESIDGYKNGKSRKYWKFWVNNGFSRIGASNYLLENKDIVIWRYGK